MLENEPGDSVAQCDAQNRPLNDGKPLAPDDLQAVADLFEIFFRWDDEAKALKDGTPEGGPVRGDTRSKE